VRAGVEYSGRPLRIERGYDLHQILLVNYRGVAFFADMVQSEFSRGIYGDKHLGDTQAVITAPILDRL